MLFQNENKKIEVNLCHFVVTEIKENIECNCNINLIHYVNNKVINYINIYK